MKERRQNTGAKGASGMSRVSHDYGATATKLQSVPGANKDATSLLVTANWDLRFESVLFP